MQRIIIIGCPGSGKSTLASQLGPIVDLPVTHIDKLVWLPGWVERNGAEFDKLLEQAVTGERWILDGNYYTSMPRRIARADAIIWLDYSRWICLYRVIRRRVVYHGQKRPDLGCTEKIDWGFFKQVWTYPKRDRIRTVELLSQGADEKRVFIFKQPKEVERWLREIRNRKKERP